MNTEWRPVIGYELAYEVSNHGKVKSLSRFRKNRWNVLYKTKEIILKPRMTPDQHLLVALCIDGTRNDQSIHRLVASAFIPNPDNLPFVNHKNGIPWDNRVTNLEWTTCRENCTHGVTLKDTTSKLRGIHWCKTRKKWRAAIQLNGKSYNLGRYNSQEEAHLAYLTALQENGIVNKYAHLAQ